MINEIISFYKTAPKLIENKIIDQTLGDFLNKKKLSQKIQLEVMKKSINNR